VNLDGAAALVAGASGAFGGAIARELAGRGARLALSGRDEPRLEELAQAIDAVGWTIADLTVDGEPERIVEASADALDGLDVVVCAIGAVAFGPARDTDDDTLRALFDVNALAPARLTRAAAARMDRGGVIANVSAIVADLPTAGMAAYSSSKAALTAFDRAAGRELRREGIRVLDVRPPLLATGLDGRPIAGRPPRLPAGRDPAEWARRVADAIADDGRADLGPEG
jgi:cyclic-di-GMP-binding biofilm dispersal mediator protein